MKAFYPLENTIQAYAWGSKEGISSFTGIPNPEGKPMAELWMGAHPGAPSKIIESTEDSRAAPDERRISLADFISHDPALALGKHAADRFNGKLPFLFKVLSAGSPLSIQVHPSRPQAAEGFARENKAGIPLSAGERNYKDDNHKPEIIMAVTPFTAMCGFRRKQEALSHLELIGSPELSPIAGILSKNGKYTDFCKELLSLPDESKAKIVEAVSAKAKEIICSGLPATTRRAYELVLKLASFYPTDIGILSPLYLNVIDLQPGQAMYLPAGVMHAYIEGTGLELMANSDNVLRGGLTPKHIDIPELLSILSPEPFLPKIIEPSAGAGFFSYRTESPEFELSRIAPAEGPAQFRTSKPAILIGSTGEISAKTETGEAFRLVRGSTAFAPALDGTIVFSGTGTAYIASIPEN
jgi:mannose-6-phosphate isomerase